MLEDSFQSLFTDEPDKEFVPGPGYDGGAWRIKPTTLMEDEADDRFPAFQRAWRDGADNDQLFGDDPFSLHGSVGRSGADNHRPDVAKAETFLNQAGYYQPMTEDGPGGYHNGGLDKSIRDFQRDNGLAVDGVLKPGGPTITALQQTVGGTNNVAAPANKQPRSPFEFSPVLYAQANSNTQNDAGPDDPADQQQAQAAPAAARLLQWGIPAAIAGGQAARNLLEDWWNKPSDLPPSQQPSPPPQQPGLEPPEKVPASPAPASPPVNASPSLENPALDETLRNILSRPLENSRGDATTQRGNDIVVDECTKVIKAEFPELGDHLKHIGGATKEGIGAKKVAEEVLKDATTREWKGGSRPDVTFQFGNDEDARYRINTTSMRGDRMTSRELASFENLKRNLGNDLASWMPKLRPGMDEREYRAQVREACRGVAGRWSDRLAEQGKIPVKGRPPQGME